MDNGYVTRSEGGAVRRDIHTYVCIDGEGLDGPVHDWESGKGRKGERGNGKGPVKLIGRFRRSFQVAE